ncbi:hypothetical protein CW745_02435 [Psychromonas sp. psych-6C06]|uniref:hypothetical protein n=1 Tax=Psychromonas sp. psych-6C06 TaxID=2058089 RepID=UPI000C335320|nr:hypothetical protein [Psychromonas sp. psych-6C06]PKF63721.1 hypothetical protein CW745_02435 [Psychromonas sp. psych-6C06]
MTEYILLAIIMVFIYFVLIRNKPAPKTDWEGLPTLPEYKEIEKTTTSEGELCCQYCGHTETIERSLNSEKENPNKNKFYHACTNCKVILWRSEQS